MFGTCVYKSVPLRINTEMQETDCEMFNTDTPYQPSISKEIIGSAYMQAQIR